MPFVDKISAQRSRGLAFSGIAAVFVLMVVSRVNINIMGYQISLSYLPLAGIFLWPRLANPLISIVGISALGCLADLLGETPLGFWAFVYLSYFIIFRPDARESSAGFWELWVGFFIAVLVAGFTMIATSFLFIGQPIKFFSLVLGWVPIMILFPLIYLSFRAIGRKGSDGSGAGFVT